MSDVAIVLHPQFLLTRNEENSRYRFFCSSLAFFSSPFINSCNALASERAEENEKTEKFSVQNQIRDAESHCLPSRNNLRKKVFSHSLLERQIGSKLFFISVELKAFCALSKISCYTEDYKSEKMFFSTSEK